MRTMFAFVMAVVLGAAAAVAAEKTIPNSIEDVKRGEWVTMEDVSTNGGETIKVTATAVGGDTITLRRERFDRDGAVIDATENEIPLSRMRERFADIKKRAKTISDEFVMIGDKEMPVVAVQWEGEAVDSQGTPHQYKIWLSDRLPLTGVAKFWSSDNGIPHAEILDYGFGGN